MNKIFIEQNSPESRVKVFIPMYKLLELTKCKKCGKIVTEPKELSKLRFAENKRRLDLFKDWLNTKNLARQTVQSTKKSGSR